MQRTSLFHHSANLFYLSLIFVSCIELEWLHLSAIGLAFGTEDIKIVIKHSAFLFLDIALLYLLPLFFKKSQLIRVFLHLLLTLFIAANLWYSRYFLTYISPSAYLNGITNMNGFLDSLIPVIKWQDSFLLLSNLLFFFCYFKLKPEFKKRKSIPRLPVICFILSLFGPTLFLIQRQLKTKSNVFRQIYGEAVVSISSSFYQYGFICSEITYAIYQPNHSLFSKKNTFAFEDIDKYKSYIKQKHSNIGTCKKNLIIILVESLSSYPIGKTFEGKELTPHLNQLVKEASFYADNLQDETRLGHSSDGQLIYMTGLLPLRDEITVFMCSKNRYHALPALLKGYTTYITIPTQKDCWKQNEMNICYGIQHMDDARQINQGGSANDEQIFQYARQMDGKRIPPFFSLVLTISMHTPYNKEWDNFHFNFPQTYSSELKSYLSATAYTDHCIGQYINSLKENNLYEDSIIIIVADHCPPPAAINTADKDIYKLPLIILNSPVDIPQRTGFIGQSSIYPTLLDIMGISSPWYGVGQSLLMPDSLTNNPYEQKRMSMKQEISEMILQTDYFNLTHQKQNLSNTP